MMSDDNDGESNAIGLNMLSITEEWSQWLLYYYYY